MKNSTIFVLVLAICSGNTIAGEQLFTNDATVKTRQSTLPSNVSVVINEATKNARAPFHNVLASRLGLQINSKALKTEQIDITLTDGEKITLRKINRHTTYTGSTVWSGADAKTKAGSLEEAMSESTLVLRNGKITGSILYKGQSYRIGADQNGSHTLVKVQPTILSDHSTGYRELPKVYVPRLQSTSRSLVPTGRREIAEYDNETRSQDKSPKSSTSNSSFATVSYNPIIRVLVNWTPAAAKVTQEQNFDLRAVIDKMMSDANKALESARSNTRLTLAYSAPVNYTETSGLGKFGNIDADTNAYYQAYNFNATPSDLVMREVRAQRDMYGADIGILLTFTTDNERVCGQAKDIGVESAKAVAVVDIVCGFNKYSFMHEIGHLVGARHLLEQDSSDKPYAYAHGYKTGSTQGDQGSIMASATSTSQQKRINRFSDPTFRFNITLPDGTDKSGVFGSIEKEDNARLMRETSGTLASFSPPPTGFPGKRNDYLIALTDPENFTVAKFVTTTSGTEPETIPKSTTKIFIFNDMTVNLEIRAKSRSIPTTTLDSLIELYIAFFNRVPDSEGLAYWIDEFKRGRTLDQIADNFYQAALLFPKETGYNSDLTNNGFIRIVYRNVLRRDLPADDEGVMYWTNKLNSGSVTRSGIITQILAAARNFYNDATFGWVPRLLDNKIVVGKVFSINKGLSYRLPETSITQGMAIASAVTATDTNAAIKLIDDSVRDVKFVVP